MSGISRRMILDSRWECAEVPDGLHKTTWIKVLCSDGIGWIKQVEVDKV